jgi:hypothetical protein
MPRIHERGSWVALWARVFTPTSGVCLQCTSRPSSPASSDSGLSPVRGCSQRALAGGRDAGRMPGQSSSSHPASPVIRSVALCAVVVLCLNAVPGPAAGADAAAPAAASTAFGSEGEPAELGWVWPADAFRLSRAYVAPAHEYGPGHRGIDLALIGSSAVRAPADGVVAFAGRVAGRGVLTIDHGGGLVTTLEPVDTTLVPGVPVRRSEDVGTLALGGHAAAGELHFGVRLSGEYINPMLLLGGVPRAVLLPCCD